MHATVTWRFTKQRNMNATNVHKNKNCSLTAQLQHFYTIYGKTYPLFPLRLRNNSQIIRNKRSIAIEKILSFVFQHDNWIWCKCYLKYFFTNKFRFNFTKCHLLIRNEKNEEYKFEMLAGSHYLSLRSLCNLQQTWLEIVYFWHSNGNLHLICNTRNKSDFHAGTWPRGNVHGTQSSGMVFEPR